MKLIASAPKEEFEVWEIIKDQPTNHQTYMRVHREQLHFQCKGTRPAGNHQRRTMTVRRKKTIMVTDKQGLCSGRKHSHEHFD